MKENSQENYRLLKRLRCQSKRNNAKSDTSIEIRGGKGREERGKNHPKLTSDIGIKANRVKKKNQKKKMKTRCT